MDVCIIGDLPSLREDGSGIYPILIQSFEALQSIDRHRKARGMAHVLLESVYRDEDWGEEGVLTSQDSQPAMAIILLPLVPRTCKRALRP
jgi:hypothetical protein